MMKKFLVVIILLGICSLCFGNSEGVLEIVNVTEPFTYSGRMTIIHSLSGSVTDGFDDLPYDIELDYNDLMLPRTTFLYSVIPDYELLRDTRPADGTQDIFYLIFATSNGLQALLALENHLVVNFYETYPPPPEPPFGDKQIVLFSDNLEKGYVIDVRAAINNGDSTIQLENIRRTGEYGFAWLIIGDGYYLCDINMDCICNFKDLQILAADWEKPYGKYRGDISGPEGVPDGYVDFYDLKAFAEQKWLTLF